MSSRETEYAVQQDSHLQYRTLSMLALASLILAVMSVPAIIFPALLALPVAGALTGISAVMKIRRNRDQLTGIRVATIGILLSVAIAISATAYHAVVFMTEVPEGFQRITFRELQPEDENSRLPIPPSAIELNGKQVFVKGYVYPGVQKQGIKKFVLVPDMGTCCFGGQPKLTDMIEVTLRDPQRIKYSYACRKLAGTLKVSPQKKAVSGLDGVYYQLVATDVLK